MHSFQESRWCFSLYRSFHLISYTYQIFASSFLPHRAEVHNRGTCQYLARWNSRRWSRGNPEAGVAGSTADSLGLRRGSSGGFSGAGRPRGWVARASPPPRGPARQGVCMTLVCMVCRQFFASEHLHPTVNTGESSGVPIISENSPTSSPLDHDPSKISLTELLEDHLEHQHTYSK